MGFTAPGIASRRPATKSTQRSRQAPAVASKTNCCTGRQSRNSFPIRIEGPTGTSSSRSCHEMGAPAAASLCCCTVRSVSDVSTKWTVTFFRKPGATRSARSASAMSVPRPGPSSMRRRLAGSPICRHVSQAHKPMSSPKIWEISGAVIKSPARPIACARL